MKNIEEVIDALAVIIEDARAEDSRMGYFPGCKHHRGMAADSENSRHFLADQLYSTGSIHYGGWRLINKLGRRAVPRVESHA